LLLITKYVAAQDSTSAGKGISIPDKVFFSLSKKSSKIEKKLSIQTDKYLARLQKQENKLKNKLGKKDTSLAKDLFKEVEARYDNLRKAKEKLNTSVYSGHLDSLTTSLHFLKDNNFTANPELQKTLIQYKSFQTSLSQAEFIKEYLCQRQHLLKEQFIKLGMVKELKNFQKQAYYYSAQIQEYKQVFEEPSKLETLLIEAVLKVPAFQDFFHKNTLLGSLFALPGSNGSSFTSFAGLQTRASLNQFLVDRFGSGPNTTQMLRQNLQEAEGELNLLKSKMSQYSSGSYGKGDGVALPEGFTPNQQKTKSFLGRLEYGTNLQTARSNYMFPVTSDFGFSLGYKLNNKSSIGVGASYKLGWGSNWDHIRITKQGFGLRSYLSYKLKGSLFISGGYEKNYLPLIKKLFSLYPGGVRGESPWHSSGLIGLSKKYRVRHRKCEMMLLWDFLSYQQVHGMQPIVFRLGYSLK
jgi:hypothetical protein